MKDKLILFSMMKEEPENILKIRLTSLEQLSQQSYDEHWIMESFEERDERGFGVITNVSDETVNICQYGILTTFEQLSQEQIESGIVVCDLFDAMTQYDLTPYWKKLSLRHQALTNSGVFVYVPSGQNMVVTCYFVQDNSVEEVMIKTVFIVKGRNAQVTFNQVDLSFGDYNNFASVEVVEIDEIT